MIVECKLCESIYKADKESEISVCKFCGEKLSKPNGVLNSFASTSPEERIIPIKEIFFLAIVFLPIIAALPRPITKAFSTFYGIEGYVFVETSLTLVLGTAMIRPIRARLRRTSWVFDFKWRLRWIYYLYLFISMNYFFVLNFGSRRMSQGIQANMAYPLILLFLGTFIWIVFDRIAFATIKKITEKFRKP